jgi:hypothetical protein
VEFVGRAPTAEDSDKWKRWIGNSCGESAKAFRRRVADSLEVWGMEMGMGMGMGKLVFVWGKLQDFRCFRKASFFSSIIAAGAKAVYTYKLGSSTSAWRCLTSF